MVFTLLTNSPVEEKILAKANEKFHMAKMVVEVFLYWMEILTRYVLEWILILLDIVYQCIICLYWIKFCNGTIGCLFRKAGGFNNKTNESDRKMIQDLMSKDIDEDDDNEVNAGAWFG